MRKPYLIDDVRTLVNTPLQGDSTKAFGKAHFKTMLMFLQRFPKVRTEDISRGHVDIRHYISLSRYSMS